MNDKNKTDALASRIAGNDDEKFGGYTIDDIRYRRALVALQKEFARQKIGTSAKKITRHSPFSKDYQPAHGGMMGKAGAIAGKLITGLNYMDYILLGFSAFNTGKKVLRLFKRKK